MIDYLISKALLKKIKISHSLYLNKTVVKRLEDILSSGSLPVPKETGTSLQGDDLQFIEEMFGDNRSKRLRAIRNIYLEKNLSLIVVKCSNAYLNAYSRVLGDDVVMFKAKNVKTPEEFKRFKKIIDYLFNYTSFNKGLSISTSNDSIVWNRHQYINLLKIKVCPYCNRNYITSYMDGKKKITTADADHYYPKSMYPILQMNIYNMIPSCNVCNSKMKLDSDERHLHPLLHDCSDNLKFEIEFNTINELYNFSEDDIEIKIIAKTKTAEASKDVFKLDKVYKMHNDIVFDLKEKIRLKEEFNEKYYRDVYKISGLEELLSNELNDYWFDFLGKEDFSEPLVKLKKDIYKQIISELK